MQLRKEFKKLKIKNIKIQSLHREIQDLSMGIVKGQSFNGMPKTPSNDNRTEDLNIKITDKIDEFTLMAMRDYSGKEFKSINSSDFKLSDDKEKEEEVKKIADENKTLIEKAKELGQTVDSRLVEEFKPELMRYAVEGKKLERVHVNKSTKEVKRDQYGTIITK